MNLSPTSFWIVIGIISAGVYGVIAATIGIKLQFVSLLEVYDVRDEYKAGLAGGAGIVGYLDSTQANYQPDDHGPRHLLQALGARAPRRAGTGCPLLRDRLQDHHLLRACHDCLPIVDQAQGLLTYTSLFTRRFLLTPGMLTSAYISFYNDNDFAYLSHSILEPWIQNQYQFAPARMIGLSITGNPVAAFNANISR